ncbi:MAG TPA: hypothetical protein VJ845_01255 [Haploplasma sp.]|nr:hypothetical protein [Haploplasma sp.]
MMTKQRKNTLAAAAFITMVAFALIIGVIINQPKKYHRVESNAEHAYIVDTNREFAVDPNETMVYKYNVKIYFINEQKYKTLNILIWNGGYYVYY